MNSYHLPMMDKLMLLYDKCLSNNATNEERSEFIALMRIPENSVIARQLLMKSLLENNEKISVNPETSEAIIQAIMRSDVSREPIEKPDEVTPLPTVRRRFINAGWIRYAAAAVLIVSIGFFIWNSSSDVVPPVQTVSAPEPESDDVAPGGNKATLTLAGGSIIVLDSASNGKLAAQGGTQVVKLANGNLAYVAIDDKNATPVYHTMSTPRGGQYQLRLPDGTQVWLNAASSITYPTSFTGRERKVTMTGEGYFEVAKNAKQPFFVEAQGTTISVIGTHFNINAYNGEPSIKTTLLEGAVKVAKGNMAALLRPGQQAQVKQEGKIAVVNDVDKDEVVAWKNGYFHFTDADMPTVMKQLERWYDIEVTYEGEIPVRSFGGGIQRSLPLSKVLTILEENGVKFKIEGRKIKVLK